MSLKYVWCLTAPERQVLTRIAKGRCGRRARLRGKLSAPAPGSRGDAEPEGADGTDEAIADAWDASRDIPRLCGGARARHRGSTHWPARGLVPRIRYETMRCTLKTELTPWRRVQRGYPPGRAADFAVPMETGRELYSQPCAARYPALCQERTPQTTAGRPADAVTDALGMSRHL